MTPQEAQFILAAVHPDRRGESDPRFAEALRVVEANPTLRDWYAREQSFDRAMTRHLGSVVPPEGLRGRILAGQRVSRPSRSWWSSWTPARLALAASLVAVLVAAAFLLSDRRSPSDRLAAEVARYLDEEWDHRFDRQGSDYQQLREWLAAQPTPISLEIPERLAGNPTFGCRVFACRGHLATLVCFRVGELGTVIHVVSLPVEALPGFEEARPRLASTGGWTTATWRRGARVYVALTPASAEALNGML